jgi:hypothetical protein
MKFTFTLLLSTFCFKLVFSQTPITAVTTTSSSSATSFSYTNGGNTYNWAVNPNNATVLVDGFTAGGQPYTYASFLNGTVKLRRVNNAGITGNFSLIWAEVVNNGTIFNMLPAYQNDMEAFFDNRAYNKGTDNFFDNTSGNSNNIERLDWILGSSFATTNTSKIGFAIFERGAVGAHDPFCIAAITAVDASGNPSAYGNIVRVASASYGDPGPNVTYRILKAPFPSNLLDAGTATQNRGGVIVSLQNLGIAANQPIFGYSLFSNDLPVSATPANLVDFTNTTFFPTNTGNPGGIDLIAVTGIYIETVFLPVKFIDFSATAYNDNVKLSWIVEHEVNLKKYDIERSTDGTRFEKVGELPVGQPSAGKATYYFNDPVAGVASGKLYYRIKQYDTDNSFSYSKIVAIKRSDRDAGILLYPNPVADALYLNISHGTTTDAVIAVFNAAGAQVLVQNEAIAAGNNAFTIQGLGKLPRGSYVLSVKLRDGASFSEQFSKQ